MADIQLVEVPGDRLIGVIYACISEIPVYTPDHTLVGIEISDTKLMAL